jgi:uncharacterized MAPEG superfamily protein
MTPELMILVQCVILTFILIAIPAGISLMSKGPVTLAGSRDDLPDPTGFEARAIRTRNNMLENMIMFAPLIIVAHLAEVSTANTVLGAQLFLYARMLHAIVYLAGWPWIRTLVYGISLIGMVMIVVALLGA